MAGRSIQNGSIRQSERLAKYNRLLEIEEATRWPLVRGRVAVEFPTMLQVVEWRHILNYAPEQVVHTDCTPLHSTVDLCALPWLNSQTNVRAKTDMSTAKETTGYWDIAGGKTTAFGGRPFHLVSVRNKSTGHEYVDRSHPAAEIRFFADGQRCDCGRLAMDAP